MLDLEEMMSKALQLAERAKDQGEVPVGALIVYAGEVVAEAHNLVETERLATRHAELLVIEQASRKVNNWRLVESTLIVTLEPCPMCISAIRLARIPKIVFGAYDPRIGACGSAYALHSDPKFGAIPEVIGGVMHDQCLSLIKSFFQGRRLEAKQRV